MLNWITRGADPNHGRVVVLRLTEDGRQVLRQCDGDTYYLNLR